MSRTARCCSTPSSWYAPCCSPSRRCVPASRATGAAMETATPTLNALLAEHARRTPERPFIHHRDGTLDYRRTQALVECLAGALHALGLGPGARLGIALGRRPEGVLAFLAATRIGALPVALNPALEPRLLLGFARAQRLAALLAEGETLAALAAGEVPEGMALIDRAGRHPGCLSWPELLGATPIASPPEPESGQVAYLNFTTGTTGWAKGALATHANLYWNTRAAIEAFALGPDDVHLCMFAAFAHPHELFCRALQTGGALVLLEEINPRAIAGTIRAFGVTCMMGLAPMYRMMAGACARADLASLRLAESGGMYTSPEINAAFAARGGVPVMSVWGSTETSGVALANTAEGYRLDGSMGRVCPHYQARVVDEQGRELPPGEVGELQLRGPGLVSGYDGGIALAGHQGWYRSGDLVRRDDDGFYYYVERISGMIKVAGLKVYPLQLELLLGAHPGVREAAVLGRPDRRKGAVPVAFVVPEPGAELDAARLRAHCRAQGLPNYMVPRRFELVDDLPRIGSGKIDKRPLRTLVERGSLTDG
ncbi:hypothetical protein EBL84_12640 [Marichromatium sp. AB31]|nr:hypothetical protein EBL84_12640 [Marichromatium sp. AB31]